MRWIVLIVLCLAACGRNDQTELQASSKPLFSTWSSSGSTIDLTGLGFKETATTSLGIGGTVCHLTIRVTGSETAGTAVGFFKTAPPAQCSGKAFNYTYTKTADTLTICAGGSCGEFK